MELTLNAVSRHEGSRPAEARPEGLKKLAERAKAGDKAAFGSLVKQYEHDLFAVSYCILQNTHDCADAVQEALIKAYTKLAGLREPQHFKTWLIRIVINECNRLIRSNARFTPMETLDGVASNGEEQEFAELIAALPENQRLVLVLHYYEGYSVGEIAHMLNIPMGTVKSRAFAARNGLKKLLEEEY